MAKGSVKTCERNSAKSSLTLWDRAVQNQKFCSNPIELRHMPAK